MPFCLFSLVGLAMCFGECMEEMSGRIESVSIHVVMH